MLQTTPSTRILVACERSGALRRALNALEGVYALSCDLLEADDGETGRHYKGDVRDLLGERWDAMVAFPDCTFLTSSGLHWNGKIEGRQRKTEEALGFVRELLGADIPLIALENPVGCISSRVRKPDQIIQPWMFGEDASKATCLWLKGLPKLLPTLKVEGRLVDGKRRWANQTDSGQNRLGPSPERARERGRTYEGVARAMAGQWFS